jgi:hypothetical protein
MVVRLTGGTPSFRSRVAIPVGAPRGSAWGAIRLRLEGPEAGVAASFSGVWIGGSSNF